MVRRFKATLVVAALLAATGCNSSAPSNTPGPTVTGVEQVANDALQIATIKAKLIGIDPDSTTTVGVSAHDGVATLRGTMRTAQARDRAVAAARTVNGIHEVRDEVRIDSNAPTVAERVGDAALAARITAAILLQTGSTAVNVSVRDGVATLGGNGIPPHVRAVAMTSARSTTGVHRVVDKMK